MSDELRSDPSAGTPIMGLSDARHESLTPFEESGHTLALRNCYAYARRMHGRTGSDDWAHIIRFCENAGLKPSPLRGSTDEWSASERPASTNVSDADGAKREEGE